MFTLFYTHTPILTDCLTSLTNIFAMLDVNFFDYTYQMFTPGLALLVKRTEIKRKLAKNPNTMATLPQTPIYYPNFATNTVALLELFYGAPGVYL
jgi:hypothetical protein